MKVVTGEEPRKRPDKPQAVDCYFDDTMPRPKLIRLHFVRDEVLVA